MPFPHDSELGAPSRLLAIALFVLLLAATLTAVVRYRPQAGLDGGESVEALEPGIAFPEPAELAFVWVDAVPWGRVERIASPGGELHPVPEPAETPLVLGLPAGDWVVTLSNPEAGEELECRVSLALGSSDSCRVEFERLSVDDYFREAGWWR